jgi:phosphatidyl-myo-inositol dimannoside synthase
MAATPSHGEDELTNSSSHVASAEDTYLALSEQYLPTRGGHVVLLHELCRRLGRASVLTGKLRGLPSRETVDGVDVRRINLSRVRFLRPESLALYGNLFIGGAGAVRQSRPSIILAARALPEGLIATLLGRMLGIPTAVFAHGEEITPWLCETPTARRRKGTAFAKGRLLWRTYRKADIIVANSRFTRSLLTDGGILPGKIALVNPGTDPRQFQPMPRDESLVDRLGLGGKRVLLTVGRLTWRKGQDMVIRALPEIVKAVPNCMYVICGAGPYEAGLRELTLSLRLDSRVLFIPNPSSEILPSIYNLSDVFVMPNRMAQASRDVEGFGIVFLEANACGIPVVGGRSGGTSDAVNDGETGLLVDGASPSEIASAVTRLLQDPALARRMGAAGRARVLREFTWDRAAGKLAAAIAASKALTCS